MNKLLGLLLIISTDWLLNLLGYFEIYIYADWGFAKYLLILIILDTIVGIYGAIKLSRFKWGEIDMLVDKLISYISILILIHVITSFKVGNETVTLFHWMRITVLSGLMAKEGFSILRNIAEVNINFIPVWLLKRFESFNKTGNFTIDNNETKKNKRKSVDLAKKKK